MWEDEYEASIRQHKALQIAQDHWSTAGMPACCATSDEYRQEFVKFCPEQHRLTTKGSVYALFISFIHTFPNWCEFRKVLTAENETIVQELKTTERSRLASTTLHGARNDPGRHVPTIASCKNVLHITGTQMAACVKHASPVPHTA